MALPFEVVERAVSVERVGGEVNHRLSDIPRGCPFPFASSFLRELALADVHVAPEDVEPPVLPKVVDTFVWVHFDQRYGLCCCLCVC